MQRGKGYLVQFGGRGMEAHQHPWLAQPDAMDIAENVIFEHDVARPDAAAIVYGVDDMATAVYLHDFNPTPVLRAVDMLSIVGSPTVRPALLNAGVISQTATSPGVTWVLSLGGGFAVEVGEACILALAQFTPSVDNSVTGITDSKGNTWVRLTTVAGDAGQFSQSIWMVIPTVRLAQASGDTVTVTFARAPDAAHARGERWQGLSTTVDDFVRVPGVLGGDPTMTFSRLRHAPNIIFGAAAWYSSTVTLTWDFGLSAAATVTGASMRSSLATHVTEPFLIVAQTEFDADLTGNVAGTVAITAGQFVVTGTATSFGAGGGPNAAGDELTIAGETHTVDEILSPTSLVTTTAWRQTTSGVAAKVRTGRRIITATFDYTAGGNAGQIFKAAEGSQLTAPNTGALYATTLKSGLAVDARQVRMIAAGKETSGQAKKLVIVNGIDRPQVLSGDGVTTTDLATPAADWATGQDPNKQPINGLVHRNNLILFGNWNDPHRIYLADPDDHEMFAGGQSRSIRIASQLGKRLYGAAEFQGVAFFWKYPQGIFYLDDTDIDYVNWSYHTRSEALGCAPSPYAVLATDRDVLFMTPDAHIHQLSAVADLGGTTDSDLTRVLGLDGWVRDHLDLTRLETLTSVYNPYTKTAYFGCRSRSPQGFRNDLLLKFDFGLADRGGPVRFSYSTTWSPNAVSLVRRDLVGMPALMIGESKAAFFVDPSAYGFRGDRLPGTAASAVVPIGFPHRLRTEAQDLAAADTAARGQWKHFRMLEVQLGEAATTALSLAIYVDGSVRQVFPVPAAVAFLQRSLMVGRGRQIAIELASDGAAPVSPTYAGLVLYYDLGAHGADRAGVTT
jgi:hypothetical protein